MNQQEQAIAEAKKLIKVAPDGPPCFERSQMAYILSRFDGTAGAPFPDGEKPNALDERHLTNRLAELNREVARRVKPKGNTHAAA